MALLLRDGLIFRGTRATIHSSGFKYSQVASIELTSDTKKMLDEQMSFFWVMIGIMLLMVQHWAVLLSSTV